MAWLSPESQDPEGSKCAFPAPHPRKTLSGYTTVMPVGFARGVCFLKLSDQAMFPHSKNNTDGVCHSCENKFCILFRGDKKDGVRKGNYITRVTQTGEVLTSHASPFFCGLPLPVGPHRARDVEPFALGRQRGPIDVPVKPIP